MTNFIGQQTYAPEATLRFSPYAWAKLLYMRDKGDTEVGGFGITSIEDPLCIEDFVLVKQETTAASVELDDEAVAIHFESMYMDGIEPVQCGRIWIHTHPGNMASPSSTDEDMFNVKFGEADWAVMFILAKDGKCSAALQYNINPAHRADINVEIDYDIEFYAADHDAWEEEYERCVTKRVIVIKPTLAKGKSVVDDWGDGYYRNPYRGIYSEHYGAAHWRDSDNVLTVEEMEYEEYYELLAEAAEEEDLT